MGDEWPYWRVWLSKREIPEDWSLYDLLDANEALDVDADIAEWRRLNPPQE